MTDYIATKIEYLVCHNGVNVYHFVETFDGSHTGTALPNIDVYATIEDTYVVHGGNLPPLE